MGFVGVYDLELDKNKIPQLVRVRDTVIRDKEKIHNVDVAVDVIETIFKASKKAEEVLYMLCIDCSGKLKGAFVISKGSIGGTIINMKGIFTRALLSGAEGIILAHNHPSGEAHFSKYDKKSLEDIWKMCNTMELDLIDFFVIGDNEFVSSRDLICELKERNKENGSKI